MAAKSTLKNMVLCLFGTTLICSAVLAGVYAVTKEPIEETNKAILTASISKVLPEGGEISDAQTCEVGGQPSECWFSMKDGQMAGVAVKSTVVGFGGPLTIMVGILPDGTIYNTSVLSHSETPGLGAKCTDENFFGQFKGWNPEQKKLLVKKDGGDVDAITASTITSRAYTLAVQNALYALTTLPLEGGEPVVEGEALLVAEDQTVVTE
mgnify:FL=1